MIINFDATNLGKPILLNSNVKPGGWLIIQSYSPIWVSTNPALANPQPFPQNTNLELRDGVYVDCFYESINGRPQPVVLPWNGPVYVLNGKGAADNVLNAANIQIVQPC